MTEHNGRNPVVVQTGLLDDHYRRDLLVGLLTWVLTFGLIATLLLGAHAPIDVLWFVIVLCVGVAAMNIIVAVQVLRPELMHHREEPPERPLPPADPVHDALGRSVALLPPAGELTGEILVEAGPDGVRRYVPKARSR